MLGSNIPCSDDIGDLRVPQADAIIFAQKSAQICIVNRAPATEVDVTGGQIKIAIDTVLNQCCGSLLTCGGGQQQITATSGNVIDLSVQGVGSDCSHN